MILVASRSVFSVFNTDEEIFANTQIWKNLLRRTCTERLWAGERDSLASRCGGEVLIGIGLRRSYMRKR